MIDFESNSYPSNIHKSHQPWRCKIRPSRSEKSRCSWQMTGVPQWKPRVSSKREQWTKYRPIYQRWPCGLRIRLIPPTNIYPDVCVTSITRSERVGRKIFRMEMNRDRGRSDSRSSTDSRIAWVIILKNCSVLWAQSEILTHKSPSFLNSTWYIGVCKYSLRGIRIVYSPSIDTE